MIHEGKGHQLVKSYKGDMKTESLGTKVRAREGDIKVSCFPNVLLCFDLFRHSEAAPA